jgi:serine/threonine protein kinase
MVKKSFRKSHRKRISKKKRISKGGFLLSKNYVFNEENIIYTITYYRLRYNHYKIQIDSLIYEHNQFDEIPALNKAHIIKFILLHSEKRKLLDLAGLLLSNLNLNDIIPREIYDPNLLHKFKFKNEIGKGGVGSVFMTDDNTYLVKKIIKFKYGMILNILNEVHNYYKLMNFECQQKDERFCKIIASYYNESKNELFIVMEICGYDLNRTMTGVQELRKSPYITNQNYSEGLLIILEIAKAIQCMHSNNYVHLDIKPHNIVVDDGKIKLIDFGMSEFISNDLQLDEFQGSSGFTAPDLMDLKYTELQSTDVYALGIILNMFIIINFDTELLLSFNKIPPEDRGDKFIESGTHFYLLYLIKNRFMIFETRADDNIQRQLDVRDEMKRHYNRFIQTIYDKFNVDPLLSDITTLARKMISFEHADRPNITKVISELQNIIENRNAAAAKALGDDASGLQ